LDFSGHSEDCLKQAIFMADACESDITLLHVMQPPHEQPGVHPTDTLGWEISRQQASANLEKFEKAARASGRPTETVLEQGRPAERIAAVAHDRGADLVVLGSHGEGGATMVSLGSTTQHVLALAQGSVFIARALPTQGESFSPKRILLPLDGSPRTESTLPTVARIARRSGAEVLLAHVVPDPLPTEVLGAQEDIDLARELAGRLESRAKRYLARIQEQLQHDSLQVRSVVVRNADQPQSLLKLAQEEGVDLIALCAHGATCNRERSFGSVSTYLLAHAPMPLVVLQDLAEAELHIAGSQLERAPRPPSMQARGSA
jgi:nucleotide-binding universal stress UspA family protein